MGFNKFWFLVGFWTEISAKTERCNGTETEIKILFATKILAESDAETKISSKTDTETDTKIKIIRSLI